MLSKNIDIMVPKRTSDTTFDCIYKYYFGKHGCKLSPKEDEIRQRWKYAWDQMATGKSKYTVVRMVTEKFDISDRQAYFDINNAELLFLDPNEGNTKLHRAKVNRWIELMIEKLIEKEDYDALHHYIGKYIKNNNTEGDDNILGDIIKKIKPTKIVFTSDDQELKKQANKLLEDVEDAEIIEDNE